LKFFLHSALTLGAVPLKKYQKTSNFAFEANKSHFLVVFGAHCVSKLYIKLLERPQYKLISFFFSDVVTITAMFKSKQGKSHSSVVPKKQGKKNKNMPPLVTMPHNIHNPRNDSFGKFCDVKEKKRIR